MTHKRVDGGAVILSLAEMFEPIRATDDAGVAILHGGHHSGDAGAAANTINITDGARYVILQAVTQNTRYTLDGTTPTATKGFQLKAGDAPRTVFLSHRTILKVIREAAGGTLEYLFGV